MRLDRNAPPDDAYKMAQGGSTALHFDGRSTKGYSSMKGSRGNVFGQFDGTTVGLHNSVAYSTQGPQSEEELWKDFHQHFSNNQRRKTP